MLACCAIGRRPSRAHAKTIVFVTHDVHAAACLGDRVLLMSPRPGRIEREFTVPLPHPREVISPALVEFAAQFAGALKEAGPSAAPSNP